MLTVAWILTTLVLLAILALCARPLETGEVGEWYKSIGRFALWSILLAFLAGLIGINSL